MSHTTRLSLVERKNELSALLKRVEAAQPVSVFDQPADWSLEKDIMAATLVHDPASSFKGFQMYWVGGDRTNSLCLLSKTEDVVRLIDERLTGAEIGVSRRKDGTWEASVNGSTSRHAALPMALLSSALKTLIAEAGDA